MRQPLAARGTVALAGLLLALLPPLTAAVSFAGVPIGAATISELRIDQPGTDNDEYFELAGDPAASLDGLTYLVIGDGTGGSGVIEEITTLTGQVIPASGFFVAAEATFTLGTEDLTTDLNFENSDRVTHLLVGGFSGSLNQDLDTNDDGVLDVTPWSQLLDCVALIDPAGTDRTYCGTLVGPDGTFVPGHVYVCPAGWSIGPFDPVGGDDTPGAANACAVPCSITDPADIAVPNDPGACGAVVTFALPASSGDCGTITCAPASGTLFPVGQTSVLCGDGTTSVEFFVTVGDVEPPTVTAPDLVVGTDPGVCSAVVAFTAPASDNCTGVGTPVCVPPSGSTFPLGATPVACTVSDAAGNVGNDAGSITVFDDEAPLIACPADIAVDAPPGAASTVVDYPDPTASDNCTAAPATGCDPPSGAAFAVGTTTVVCTATDAAGIVAQCDFDVVVGTLSIPEIPALSPLGLAALGLLLAGFALLLLRRAG